MADSKVEYPAPDCLTPAAIEAKTEAAGVTKANLPVAKAFLLAMFAGAFIAFGGLFFTVFLSDSTLGWGAQRVVGGLCFCLGLVLVLVCGAELFTGNTLLVISLLDRRVTWCAMLRNWGVVYLGNFLGALARVDVRVACAGMGGTIRVTVQLPANELPAGLAIGAQVVVAPRPIPALAV